MDYESTTEEEKWVESKIKPIIAEITQKINQIENETELALLYLELAKQQLIINAEKSAVVSAKMHYKYSKNKKM